MVLKFKPFAASSAMAQALLNKPPLKVGTHGPAVALLQGALIDMGFKLPNSTKSGAPDGFLGPETQKTLKEFQAKHKIAPDGVAGGKTIGALDAAMAAKVPPSVVKPAASPSPPAPRHYRMGSADPPVTPDVGAGRWRSKPVMAAMAGLKVAILMRLQEATLLVGRDAAKHMQHYLGNSGRDYTIDLEGMLKDVPSARTRLGEEIQQAQSFTETLAPGRYEFTSAQAEDGYNYEEENRNWYFALGGYQRWGKGVATVSERSGRREYALDYEYKVFDRYNWDGDKSVTLFHITVTDEFMGEFHRQGLAQEFNCFGSLKRRVEWRHGERIHLRLGLQPQTDRV
jgi:peptidoglycan hydrolase-like protein with peptidoglycan-binding domain